MRKAEAVSGRRGGHREPAKRATTTTEASPDNAPKRPEDDERQARVKTTDQDKPQADKHTTIGAGSAPAAVPCSSSDQRYCLQCGARHGKPRLDFTAFWQGCLRLAFSTKARRGATGPGSAAGAGRLRSGWRDRRGTVAAVIGALVACVLAVGILAGAHLDRGPRVRRPTAATLAQRAIAALDSTGKQHPAGKPPATPARPQAKRGRTRRDANERTGKEDKATSKATSSPEAAYGKLVPANAPRRATLRRIFLGRLSKARAKAKKPRREHRSNCPDQARMGDRALRHELRAALQESKIDPYLAKQLVPKGTLLSNYKLSASSELGNGIALLAGQSVNLDTEQNCPTYTELQPPTINATTGLAEGVGCVYPATVKTLADELSAGALTWKAYVQDMDRTRPPRPQGRAEHRPRPAPRAARSPPAQAARTAHGRPAWPARDSRHGAYDGGSVTCRRPELGATDPNHTPVPGDPYLTYRNPFVYFDSLLSEGACASNDVDLTQLQGDLATPADTPSLSWIVPSACNDGSSTPCAAGRTHRAGTRRQLFEGNGAADPRDAALTTRKD